MSFCSLIYCVLFDFEKLEVYKKLRELNKSLLPIIFKFQSSYPYLADQLKRASLSIQLNLAEGTGRMSSADKKQFYIRARASTNECVSVLHSLIDLKIIEKAQFDLFYKNYEEISKMLLGLIRALK